MLEFLSFNTAKIIIIDVGIENKSEIRIKNKELVKTTFITLIILQNLFAQNNLMLEIEVGNAHSQITDTLETNNKVPQLVNNDFEIFPILSYDTDTGFGYGLKSFFLNFLGINESFDLILFNSTKGSRV